METKWKIGTKIEVQLSGSDFDVLDEGGVTVFEWNGNCCDVVFRVRAHKDIEIHAISWLQFVLRIEGTPVGKVVLPLRIRALRISTARLFAPLRTVEQLTYATGYASYAAEDRMQVNERLNGIEPLTGISFFRECLSVTEDGAAKSERQRHLSDAIAQRHIFMLFWSQNAARSSDVKWEWSQALRRPGREAMDAQPLSSQAPQLPAELTNLGSPVMEKLRMKSLDNRYFTVGCVLAAFVAGLIVWTFVIRDLSPSQKEIMRVVLPLASGFCVGSFVGAFTVNARGFLPGMVATATGGFGVWLIIFLSGVLSGRGPFNVVVQPHGPGGPTEIITSGTVTLQVGSDRKQEDVGAKGQAHFVGIPGEFDGAPVHVVVKAAGFSMKDPDQMVELRPNTAVNVPLKRDP